MRDIIVKNDTILPDINRCVYRIEPRMQGFFKVRIQVHRTHRTGATHLHFRCDTRSFVRCAYCCSGFKKALAGA